MKTKSVQYFGRKERENTCMVTWKKSEKCKVEKGPFNDNFTTAHQSKNNAPKLSFVCCPEPTATNSALQSQNCVRSVPKPTYVAAVKLVLLCCPNFAQVRKALACTKKVIKQL